MLSNYGKPGGLPGFPTPAPLRVHRDSTEGEMNGCIVAKQRKTKQNNFTIQR